MPRNRAAGFTLIELLVVITIIGILAAIALPNYIKAKDKAKEAQARSALKSIQVAVERYQVDFGKFPGFLLGGDVEGWRVWHERYDEATADREIPQNRWVHDQMIVYSYLEAYPPNPFVDSGQAILTQTGDPSGPNGEIQAGDGDPRFGFRGTTMGNTLDDPAWSLHRITGYPAEETSVIEMSRTLQDWQGVGFIRYQNGTVYTMGGRVLRSDPGNGNLGGGPPILDENGDIQFVYTFWPGNFFYRGLFDIPVLRKGYTHFDPGGNPGTEINRYLMGIHGSFSTRGYDVIRLEASDFNGQHLWYHQPPPWDADDITHFSDIHLGYADGPTEGCGLPEISGGGNAFDGPWYPYDFPDGNFGDYLYGAPDGVPDGVILVLHAGADKINMVAY